eukprot:8761307-Pyramimonas_sp.AAC.1
MGSLLSSSHFCYGRAKSTRKSSGALGSPYEGAPLEVQSGVLINSVYVQNVGGAPAGQQIGIHRRKILVQPLIHAAVRTTPKRVLHVVKDRH